MMRMSLRSFLAASVVSLVVGGIAGAPAAAKTLKAAVGLGPKSAQVFAYKLFAKYVEERTDLKIKVFSMSLLNLKETPPGLRDGVADIGFVLPPYFPAEYAETNLAANLTMLATTGTQVESPGTAMAGAMSEYIFFNCPECLAEYEKQNQVYLGSASSPTYIMLCTKPVRTMEELKGKKYRSGAANFGRWAEHFGGIKVSIPRKRHLRGHGTGRGGLHHAIGHRADQPVLVRHHQIRHSAHSRGCLRGLRDEQLQRRRLARAYPQGAPGDAPSVRTHAS